MQNHFSKFSLNYQNYWQFALLYLIIKHSQRAKHRVPAIRLVKHVKRSNFSMILYRNVNNLLRWKIWCNSFLYIVWGRKGRPTDGANSLRWCEEHTLIYRGFSVHGGIKEIELHKVGVINSYFDYEKPCVSDMLGNFIINHVCL